LFQGVLQTVALEEEVEASRVVVLGVVEVVAGKLINFIVN
jgi:hypothetical protein